MVAAKFNSFLITLKETLGLVANGIEERRQLAIIRESDRLVDRGQYVQAYELLQNNKSCVSVKVLWRIGRVLYQLAYHNNESHEEKLRIINESYELLKEALDKDESNYQVHKWMAIVLDYKEKCKGIGYQVRVANDVKNHMLRAIELNPNEYTVLHILGKWSYNYARLNWFQRATITFLYGSVPSATYEESYSYFFKAEQLKPRFYIGNTYMLGKICYRLHYYYRARYYFHIVANFPINNDYERVYQYKGRKLSQFLNKYDLAQEALFLDF